MKKIMMLALLLLFFFSLNPKLSESSDVIFFSPYTVHSDSNTLSVATYNIRGCRNDEGIADVHAIATELSELEPDIIALQEVDEGLPRSGFVDQAKELSRLLKMNYVYSPTINYVVGAYGNAVLSKYPIVSAQSYMLPSGKEPRGALRVTVDFSGTPVTLYTTHFGLQQSERELQAETVYRLIEKAQHENTTILLGDFNADQADPLLAPFRTLLIDPLTQSNIKLVTIEGDSQKQIDHIFISGNLALSYAKTTTNSRSDHTPVFFRLRLATETVFLSDSHAKERSLFP